jgi:alpha-tubulin suppressor-like RCC1 family protein
MRKKRLKRLTRLKRPKRPGEAELFKGSKIVTVAAGGHHTMAVGESGTPLAWGLGFYGRLRLGDIHNMDSIDNIDTRGGSLLIHCMAPRSPPNPTRPIPCPVATVCCAGTWQEKE